MIKLTLMMPLRGFASLVRVTYAKLFGYVVLAHPIRAEYRTDLCEKCPFYDFVEDQCLKCGCLVHAKAALNTEKCPLDRWSRVWIKKSLATD